MSRTAPILSPTGRERRELMLGSLLDELRVVRARRRTRRTAIACVAPIVLVTLLAVLAARPAGDPLPANGPSSPAPRITLVRTEPGVLRRYVVDTPTSIVIIDDDVLLDTLAAMDRPSGLIRAGGETWISDLRPGAPRVPGLPGGPGVPGVPGVPAPGPDAPG